LVRLELERQLLVRQQLERQLLVRQQLERQLLVGQLLVERGLALGRPAAAVHSAA